MPALAERDRIDYNSAYISTDSVMVILDCVSIPIAAGVNYSTLIQGVLVPNVVGGTFFGANGLRLEQRKDAGNDGCRAC